jgi:hypothetical protein
MNSINDDDDDMDKSLLLTEDLSESNESEAVVNGTSCLYRWTALFVYLEILKYLCLIGRNICIIR